MSSSDSEEFESADEDIEVEKHNKNSNLNKKSETNKLKNDAKETEKKVTTGTKSKLDDKSDSHSNANIKENEKDESIESDGFCKTIPTRMVCWEEGVNDVIPPSEEKVSEETKLEVKPPPRGLCMIPPKREGCWEAGVNDAPPPTTEKVPEEKKTEVKPLPKGLCMIPPKRVDCSEDNVPPVAPKVEETNNDEDGWDVDDWGDEIDTEIPVKKPDNLKDIFPVLDDLSPTKGHKPKPTEKYVSKHKAISSGDQFPVLNELSQKKSTLQFPQSSASQLSHAASEHNFNDTRKTLSNDDKSATPSWSSWEPKPKSYDSDITSTEAEPNFSNVLDKLSKESESSSSSWSSWKPWGGVVNSFLTSASEITKGISTAIESGIGVPDPTEMAKIHKEEVEKLQNKLKEKGETIAAPSVQDDKGMSLGNLVSGVTQISNRVISGGLDTLEGIGKKTMTILQENDPGLMNKRKLLGLDNDKPVLSQVLREAKQKTEENEKNLKQIQKHLYKKQLHFEQLFDDYHGLVHLEALEMLSKQSELKLQSLLSPLTGKALTDLQETLNEVIELCELPDQDSDDADGLQSVEELEEKLMTAVEDLDIDVEFKEFLECWRENTEWLTSLDCQRTPQEVHDKSLHCLARTTALAVNKMHKLAERILILDHHSTANEADSFVQ